METPANGQRVWRFTPRDGQPSRHVTQKGPNVTLTLTLALPYKGEGHPPVVFEQASVHHRTPNPSLLQRKKKWREFSFTCSPGASYTARENDLAATTKSELTTTFCFF